MRDFLRKLMPQFLLSWYRKRKKSKRNKALNQSRDAGYVLSKSDLVDGIRKIGVEKGDTILVHSSLSKIGYVSEGPKTVVDAFLEVIGSEGNLLMPTSPNASLQLDYIRGLQVFDVANDPSSLGAITEYFRKLPGVIRSEHPTEPVACIGPEAEYFTSGHFGSLTPYDSNSPFYKVGKKKGKILYLGVTLDNAGTSLHTLEDAIENFIYPVYYNETFEVDVRFADGSLKKMITKVHNPKQSAKRKCDGLIPLFIKKGVMKDEKIGEARALLVDAEGMFECMISEYRDNGVTMYTPDGVS